MDVGKKALVFAAGLILTVIFISIAVAIFMNASNAARTANNEVSSINNELAEQSFMIYDDTTISGSQVSNALRKFKDEGEFGILVKTGKNRTGTWYYRTVSSDGDSLTTGKESIVETRVETSTEYINPSGSFHAKVLRDSSNVIRGLEFTQK